MQIFNRLFASLMAIAWGVLLGWLLFVVWRQGQSASIESSRIHFNLGFSFSTSEQILATIVLGVLMLPAAFLLGLELFGFRRSPAEREFAGRRGPARYETLESRIARLESQSGAPTVASTPAAATEVEGEISRAEISSDPPPESEHRSGLFRRFRRHDRAQTA
jgi:hypothetical protein